MARPKHSSSQMRKLMAAFAADRQRWRYGYDLSVEAGIAAGTMYPALSRLAQDGLLEHHWELPEDAGRPRHCYRLTDEGLKFAAKLEVPAKSRLSARATPRTAL